jgi:hypothetical protein
VAGESLSGQSGWTLTGLAPGSLVAGYRVESRIGAGGMAMVLRARDEALGRTVALKILAPALAGDREFRERFVRESRAVAAVDHPHIIPVYAAGQANGILYLAMRFVAGGDLSSVVRREGPLPGDRAVLLLSPIASALDAAHAAGLVHRDVKPANILVDGGPGRPEHPYLSDFGLAKGSASSTGLTGTGQFLGTPDYAAPEQISGKPARPQTDQYALACVVYTVLAGSLPFPRDESMAVLWAHMYDPPPSLTASRPDLPAAADQVLARGLAKIAEDRYATCGEFIDALRTALSGAPRAGLSAGRHAGVTGARATDPGPADRPLRLDRPVRLDRGTRVPSPPTRTVPPRASLAAGREAAGPELTDPRPQQPPWPLAGSPSVPPTRETAQAAPPGPGGRRRARPRVPRWPVMTAAAALLVLLVVGGGVGFWRYNQGQFYVGVDTNGNVSIFRGTNQDLAGISLSSLYSESTLKATMLTASDQAALTQTISQGSASDAHQKINQLAGEAVRCQQTYQDLAAWQKDNVAYQGYLTAKAQAAKNKAKAPAVVNNPGPMPTQLPDADTCAPSTAFGVPAAALPAQGVTPAEPASANASPTVTAATTPPAAG